MTHMSNNNNNNNHNRMMTCLSTLELHTESSSNVTAVAHAPIRIWSLHYSPNGRYLACCTSAPQIIIYALVTASSTSQIEFHSLASTSTPSNQEENENENENTCVHTRTIRSLEWSHDSIHLAAASFDGLISIWKLEIASNETTTRLLCIAQLEGHENEVKDIAWSKDDYYLASCSRDRSIWIWTTPSATWNEYSHKDDRDRVVQDLTEQFSCVSVCNEHSADVKSVLWHPQHNWLLSTSYDNTIKLWRNWQDQWYCAATLIGHLSTVWKAIFVLYKQNSSSLLSSSLASSLAVVVPEDTKHPDSQIETWSSISSSTCTEIVSVSDDQTVRIWHQVVTDSPSDSLSKNSQDDLLNFACVQVLQTHRRTIFTVSINDSICERHCLQSKMNPNSRVLATAGADNSIQLYQRIHDNHQASLSAESNFIYKHIWTQHDAHSNDVNCVAFHPHHDCILVSAGDDAVLTLWQINLSRQ